MLDKVNYQAGEQEPKVIMVYESDMLKLRTDLAAALAETEAVTQRLAVTQEENDGLANRMRAELQAVRDCNDELREARLERDAAERRAEEADEAFKAAHGLIREADELRWAAERRADGLAGRATRLAWFARLALVRPGYKGWRGGQSFNPDGPILSRAEIDADIDQVLAATAPDRGDRGAGE